MSFETLHHSELHLMGFLQSIKGPFLNQLMLILNHVDSMTFCYLAIISVWMCYHRKAGLQLLFLYILSVIINQDAKIGFSQPRPYHLDASLEFLKVPFFGFPSGGAQISSTMCGFIALREKKIGVWIGSAFFLILVGFS